MSAPFLSAPLDAAQVAGAPVPATSFSLARVDLLPPEVRTARRLRRTQRVLAVTSAAVLLALSGTYALARHDEGRASAELAATRARTAQLQSAQSRYADVPKVYAEVASLRDARARALSSDVLWFDSLDHLARADPSAVWLEDVDAGLFDGDTAATDPLAPAGVGVLTVQGTGSSHPDLAAWLDALDRTPGLASAGFSKSERAEKDGEIVVDFSSTATVTPDALSHRYDAGRD